MTKFYQDVVTTHTDSLAGVFTQTHLAIVTTKNNIAVGFPQYRYSEQDRTGSMGLTLRVFAQTEKELEALQLDKRVKLLTEVTVVYPIEPVPDTVFGYCSFARVQKKNMSKVRRNANRAVAKGRFETLEDALDYMKQEDTYETRPYLYIYSNSTQKSLCFNIELIRQPNEQQGDFNSYGLSKTATVPVF